MVCGYSLGSWRVTYCFLVTVTLILTSDLRSRNIVSGASLILFKVGIPNLMCEYNFGSQSVAYCFQVTMTLTFDLSSRKIVSGAYLLYCLR